jgi:hypothetical protein
VIAICILDYLAEHPIFHSDHLEESHSFHRTYYCLLMFFCFLFYIDVRGGTTICTWKYNKAVRGSTRKAYAEVQQKVVWNPQVWIAVKRG